MSEATIPAQGPVDVLVGRLRTHAEAHEYIANADPEQKQWMNDLYDAADAIERLQAENTSFRAAMKACEDCGPNDPVWIDGKPANLEAAAAGALETIADLTDECTTFRYELARAIAQRDDEGDRLDWLMMNLAGNVTRGLLGELAHTGDPSEFRELIDEMRGERGQCVRRMPDNRICGLRAASCPSCAPAVHKVPQWRP